MAKRKRKTLPKNFEALLEQGDLAELQAVFDQCDNARGGYSKQTAIAFVDCPDDLARWLVAQGADLSVPDHWGHTPLYSRATMRRGNLGVLLEQVGFQELIEMMVDADLQLLQNQLPAQA